MLWDKLSVYLFMFSDSRYHELKSSFSGSFAQGPLVYRVKRIGKKDSSGQIANKSLKGKVNYDFNLDTKL